MRLTSDGRLSQNSCMWSCNPHSKGAMLSASRGGGTRVRSTEAVVSGHAIVERSRALAPGTLCRCFLAVRAHGAGYGPVKHNGQAQSRLEAREGRGRRPGFDAFLWRLEARPSPRAPLSRSQRCEVPHPIASGAFPAHFRRVPAPTAAPLCLAWFTFVFKA